MPCITVIQVSFSFHMCVCVYRVCVRKSWTVFKSVKFCGTELIMETSLFSLLSLACMKFVGLVSEGGDGGRI